jgi:hypothetical protein
MCTMDREDHNGPENEATNNVMIRVLRHFVIHRKRSRSSYVPFDAFQRALIARTTIRRDIIAATAASLLPPCPSVDRQQARIWLHLILSPSLLDLLLDPGKARSVFLIIFGRHWLLTLNPALEVYWSSKEPATLLSNC